MDEIKQQKGFFIFTCKKCGKKFESIYENQANNNGKIHEMNCKPKEKDKDTKNHNESKEASKEQIRAV